MVMLAWLPQGVYGQMTQIAPSYQIARTLLSHLLFVAHLQLALLLSDAKLLWPQEPRHFAPLLLW